MENKSIKFFAKSIKIAQSTNRLKEVAEKVGIVLPSTHTALFQSVYSPIEESNDNGVRLSQEAVNKALPGMVGAQANMEHLGRGWIVGLILDTWINDNNEIEIVYSFAKNIYEEEYVKALEKMQSGELAVSFELLASVEDREELADGTVLLHDIDFQGVGVLIDETPAYKNAITYEVAKKYKERVINCEDKELICASKIIENCDKILLEGKEDLTDTPKEDKTTNSLTVSSNEDSDKNKDVLKLEKSNQENNTMGGSNQMSEEQLKLVAELREKFGEQAKDYSDEDLLNAEKVEELEVAFKLTVEENFKREETDVGDTTVIETKIEKKETIDWSEQVASLEAKVACLEEENEALKATLEVKDSEIEEVRVNAEKIGKLKIELKDNSYVADFADEDYLNESKLEKAKLLKEKDDLQASNEELKKANEELAKKKEVAVKEEKKVEKEEAKVEEVKVEMNAGESSEESKNALDTILKANFNKKKK